MMVVLGASRVAPRGKGTVVDLGGRIRVGAALVAVATISLSLLVPATPADADIQFRAVEQHLRDLGYPVGAVDGVQDADSLRALCAWRRLAGSAAHRGGIQAAEYDRILSTAGLPTVSRTSTHLVVDRACQVVTYRADGRVRRVLAASTGRPGKETPTGVFSVDRKRSGWHTSTLYPAPQPNMYNTMYFNGPIAVHGAREVPTEPASAGCVRVTPSAADFLFPRVPIGTRVEVIGSWGGNLAPVPGPFVDVAGDAIHATAIGRLKDLGVVVGCGDDRYCPAAAVTRAQMASFLQRAFALPPGPTDRFRDVGPSSTHAAAIGAVHEAGITLGCSADGRSYCPNETVPRDQMASFLQRALELPPGPVDGFRDVDPSSTHAAAIGAVHEAGITVGCSADGRSYCPSARVKRDQMASFLIRALDHGSP
jgi:hypothetical protein